MARRLDLTMGTLGLTAVLAACGPDADSPTGPVPPPSATAPTMAASTTASLTGEGWESLWIGMTRAEIVDALG